MTTIKPHTEVSTIPTVDEFMQPQLEMVRGELSDLVKPIKLTPVAMVETIDAGLARHYLDLNIATNRKVSLLRVSQYSDDMLNGRWELNGEPIQFSTTNRLMNGQHRLRAIIEADRREPGITFETFVVRGIQDHAFWTMDAGKPRAAYNFMEGGYAPMRAAFVKVIMRLLAQGGWADPQISRNRQSNPAVLDFIEQHPFVEDYARTYAGKAHAASPEFRGTSATGLLLGGYVVGASDNARWDDWWTDVDLTAKRLGKPDSPVTALATLNPRDRDYTNNAKYLRALWAGTKYRDRKKTERFRLPDSRQFRVW